MGMIRSIAMEGILNAQSNLTFQVSIVGTGRLHSFLVSQDSGSLDGFTVELFSTQAAINGTVNYGTLVASTNLDTDLIGAADNHLVIEPIVAAASASQAAVYIPNGQPYFNSDTTVRGRQDFLYVVITPQSPGVSKAFSLLLTYAEHDH